MRTALGILAVIIIVIIIYLLLPPATKQAVQFWKPEYSLEPVASASPTAVAVASPTVASTPVSGFVAQNIATASPRGSVTPIPTGSIRAQATPIATLSATTRLPGTGDIIRDPILASLTLLAGTIAVFTGFRMSKYR